MLLATLVTPVAAHAELVSATPGPDAVVTTPPPILEAMFSQDLDPSRSSIEVRSAAGDRIATGGPLGGSARTMTAELPALPDGRFTVRWTSFSSEDQELARGTYDFTVRLAAASPSPSTVPTGLPTAPASLSAPPPSSLAPSAVPSPTAVPTVSLAPTPSATPAGSSPHGDATVTAVVVPIVVILAGLAIFGFWLYRQRRA